MAVDLIKDDKKLLLIRNLDEMRCALKFDVLNIKSIKNEQLISDIKMRELLFMKRTRIWAPSSFAI